MADERPAVSFWRRRRRWLVALAVLLVVRAALPEIVRRVLVTQLSERLRTRVDIGDVDLALWRGGVALKDVAVHAPPPAPPDDAPLVAWKRFAVELRYLPLFVKRVRLRQVTLEGPRIAVDRLADGAVNLQRLIPPAAPAKEAEPAEQPKQGGSAWKVGIDRLAVRTGGVRFRDLTLAGVEPLEIAIPDVDLTDVALQPGLYGDAGRLGVSIEAEGGALRVDARVGTAYAGFTVATRVKAYRIPLRRARFYVPGVGWSELDGVLDAAIDHELAPDGRNAAHGLVRLRDVAIRVPDVPEAALAVRRLAVGLRDVDVAARRAAVRSVDVAGASVVLDLAGGGTAVPLLRRATATAPAEAPPAPPAEAPPTAGAPPPAAGPPWHWSVAALDVGDTKVSLLRPEATPLDIAIDAHLRHLADAGDPASLDVRLAVPPGSLAVAGAARVAPPGFGGTVKIAALPVADLIAAARAAANLPAGLLQAASLDGDLTVEAGLGADGAAGRTDAVRVHGALALDAFQMQGPDPGAFAVAWKHFGVPVDALELPGLVPGSPPPGPAPIRVALGAVRLEELAATLTRTAEGLLLPPPLGPGAPAGPPGATPAAPPAAQPASASPPPPAVPARPAPSVTVASFTLARAGVALVDRTVKPWFVGELKPLDVDARGIRSDGPVIERFTVTAATPGKGKLDVAGSFRPEGGTVKVNGEQIALAPYNPYVTTMTPYSLGRASAVSVHTDVAFKPGSYDTKTAITLHKLAVNGAAGDTVFRQQFGIPLSMALALLRDPSGNIKLDVPVAVDASGTRVGLGTVVAGALRSAILGAVTSPLKAFGLFTGGGDATALEPPPIPMDAGRAVVGPDAEKEIGQLAGFVAGRPGLGIELDAIVTPADVRWLREQDLRTELEQRKGVVNALRVLSEIRARGRILDALAKRAEGKPGDLSADDAARLDGWLAERPALPADRLVALARARTDTVATAFRERHGVPANRVTAADAKGEAREGKPSVAVAFGAGD